MDNLLSPRKIWTFIFDPDLDLNTFSFYSNPTESSIDQNAIYNLREESDIIVALYLGNTS